MRGFLGETNGTCDRSKRVGDADGSFLADMTAGTKAVYKYFDLSYTKKITVDYSGDAAITVNNVPLSGGSCPISGTESEALCIEVVNGKADMISFTLE